MTLALTLDEFTAELRKSFPDVAIDGIHTRDQRWVQQHAATLTLNEVAFHVTYNLNPMDPSKRWGVVWSGERDVATPGELRPLIAARARALAREHLEEARKLTERAEAVAAVAKLIEASL